MTACRCVCGCLRALQGRDDIVDALLSSREGRLALNEAMAAQCRIALGLPEVQRYFDSMWTGRIYSLREEWRDEAKRQREGMDFVQKATRLFEHYDEDGSGTIDQRELMICVKELGVNPNDNEVAAILKRYDAAIGPATGLS